MTEHGTSPTSLSGGTQDRAGPGPWSQEPRTVTGRRLFTDNDPMDMLESDGVTWGDVVAIEREAATAPALDARLMVLADEMDAEDRMTGRGMGEFADEIRALARTTAPALNPDIGAWLDSVMERLPTRYERDYEAVEAIRARLTHPGDRHPGTATVFRVIRERFGYGADADDLIRALLPNAEVPGDRDRIVLYGEAGWNHGAPSCMLRDPDCHVKATHQHQRAAGDRDRREARIAELEKALRDLVDYAAGCHDCLYEANDAMVKAEALLAAPGQAGPRDE